MRNPPDVHCLVSNNVIKRYSSELHDERKLLLSKHFQFQQNCLFSKNFSKEGYSKCNVCFTIQLIHWPKYCSNSAEKQRSGSLYKEFFIWMKDVNERNFTFDHFHVSSFQRRTFKKRSIESGIWNLFFFNYSLRFIHWPISCESLIGVRAVTFRHTIADIQVTSFSPLRQSLLKILILLGSNRTVTWIRTTLRDLRYNNYTRS